MRSAGNSRPSAGSRLRRKCGPDPLRSAGADKLPLPRITLTQRSNSLGPILLAVMTLMVVLSATDRVAVAQDRPTPGGTIKAEGTPEETASADPDAEVERTEDEKRRRKAMKIVSIVSLVLILLLIIGIIVILLSGRRLRWHILGRHRRVRFSKMDDLWWRKPEDADTPPDDNRTRED